MRIGIVVAPYETIPPKKYGGTERVAYYLIKGLKELGHEVVLFGAKDSEIDCEIVPLTTESIPSGKNIEEEKILKEKRNEIKKGFNKIIKANLHKVDILHSHDSFDTGLDEFSDFPNLTTIHHHFVMGYNTEPYFKNKDKLFYNSISHNQQKPMPFLNYIGNIYHGLDPEEFKFIQESDDYLCFLGRLDRDKNPHFAIHAALRINEKLKLGGKVDFQGKEYFETECLPYIEQNREFIEYLGELDMENKTKLMGHAKSNIHPTSFREPFGLTVLEAAYLGTPTLAIRRGSMSEIIEDGKTGILVEDADEMPFSISKTFSLDRRYISETTRRKFHYVKMAKQYVKAYELIIELYKKEFNKQEDNLEKYLQNSRIEMDKYYDELTK